MRWKMLSKMNVGIIIIIKYYVFNNIVIESKLK